MKTLKTLIPLMLLSAACITPAAAANWSDDSYAASHNGTDGITNANLDGMEGKAVFGARGERLGYILETDHGAKLAQIQTPGGVAIAMPEALLTDRGSHVLAPTASKKDMTAMAKTQTGRSVALNIYMRNWAFAG